MGGDEFVAFIVDPEKARLADDLSEMLRNIEDAGYHAAVGLETMDVRHLTMDVLIESAEKKMYKSKTEFYKHHDRRKRP